MKTYKLSGEVDFEKGKEKTTETFNLSIEEMEAMVVIEEFAEGAKRGKMAGFDAVMF